MAASQPGFVEVHHAWPPATPDEPLMPQRPHRVLPTPGTRYTTDELDTLVKDAQPSRPIQPPLGTPGPRRRKQAVARRSRERVNPAGGYFYWCEHCHYVNTPAEGERARCADHQAAYEANRPRRDTPKTTPASTYKSNPELEPQALDPALLAALHARARALAIARQQRLVAERNPRDLPTATADLDTAIRGVLDLIQRLPRPTDRPSS